MHRINGDDMKSAILKSAASVALLLASGALEAKPGDSMLRVSGEGTFVNTNPTYPWNSVQGKYSLYFPLDSEDSSFTDGAHLSIGGMNIFIPFKEILITNEVVKFGDVNIHNFSAVSNAWQWGPLPYPWVESHLYFYMQKEVNTPAGTVLPKFSYDPVDDIAGVSFNRYFAGLNYSQEFGGGISQISYGPVPEPNTWVMLIGGFAIAGGAMRLGRRQSTTIQFTA